VGEKRPQHNQKSLSLSSEEAINFVSTLPKRISKHQALATWIVISGGTRLKAKRLKDWNPFTQRVDQLVT